MKITLLGAAGGEVTGSAYLVQTADANVMVDCGLFQGAKKLENFNRLPTSSALQKLDAVVLTHAHLDHTGRLPLLTRFDYKGPIYATSATIALAGLILKDSAYLQGEDAKRQNRRRAETGQAPVVPLYTQKEVDRLRDLYRLMRYNHSMEIAPGIRVRAVEAGHVLGSASLEMFVTEGGRTKVVVFSGDIGPRGAPLHKDPVPFKGADLVFLESTYGDKEHPSLADTAVAAREAVRTAVERGGRVLVPVFAVGRSQMLLYMLAGAFKRGTLKAFPVFLEKAADSLALSRKPGPWMVLAGAGMCTGGRIMNHLQNYLPDPTTLVLMVGYQSRGSVGRALADGAREVKISGQRVKVRATTHMFGGLSGHAAQSDLIRWLGSLAASRPRVVLTHGEDGPRRVLRAKIEERLGLAAEMPAYRDVIHL